MHNKDCIIQSRFWAGGMAQVVERLPSQHEALSSNPVLPKRKTIKNNVLLYCLSMKRLINLNDFPNCFMY
jgi:hypothetical protein